jgi:hypothetical protein
VVSSFTSQFNREDVNVVLPVCAADDDGDDAKGSNSDWDFCSSFASFGGVRVVDDGRRIFKRHRQNTITNTYTTHLPQTFNRQRIKRKTRIFPVPLLTTDAQRERYETKEKIT